MKTASSQYLMLLCFLIAIGQAGLGLYLPSLPMISLEFHASLESTKNTIIYYVIGIAFSQLFYGPLSDYYGRKKISLARMGIFIGGTTLAISSSTISWLLIARLIQGIGIGASTIVSRAVLRDVFHGVEYVKSGARLASIVAITPIIAPLLGGYFQEISGWRLSFTLLLLFSIITWFFWFFLFKKTTLTKKNTLLSFSIFLNNYFLIGKSTLFLKHAICGGLIYSGEVAILTVLPFFIQTQLGASSTTFGWVMLVLAFGFIAGARISVYLSEYESSHSLIYIGLLLAGISSCLLLSTIFFIHINLIFITMILFLFLLGAGIVYPNTSVTAVGLFPEKAGTASALFSGIQGSLAALSSILLSYFSSKSLYPLSILLIICTLFSSIIIESRDYIADKSRNWPISMTR